jgi:hypothetical protein
VLIHKIENCNFLSVFARVLSKKWVRIFVFRNHQFLKLQSSLLLFLLVQLLIVFRATNFKFAINVKSATI